MLNFKKGSIFDRSAKAQEDFVDEPGNQILAVWGSPGSGKSTVAVKLARGGTFAGSPKARMVNETDTGEAADQDASGESESVDSENAEPTMSAEELAKAETNAQKKSVVD